MPFKLKDLFRSRGSRSQSPLPTPPPPIPELSRAEPQDLAVQPSQTNIGPASTATNIQASPAPIGEGQNYGVKVLYDGGIKASVDIVFVHGLTGNAYNTWLHKDKGIRVHWPSELLKQDLPDARIISFGYDAGIVNFWNPASNSRLSNHAENMVGDLVRRRERTNTEFRKILFVAHNLGGLVTKHALSYSRNTAAQVPPPDRALHSWDSLPWSSTSWVGFSVMGKLWDTNGQSPQTLKFRHRRSIGARIRNASHSGKWVSKHSQTKEGRRV